MPVRLEMWRNLIYLTVQLIDQMAGPVKQGLGRMRRVIAKHAVTDRQPEASGSDLTLRKLAYDRFKTALFERRIEAGAFVSQSELVALLGVPLGPLRDALQALQAEGLVTIRARSGIEIAKADYSLVRNTYQLRLMLERHAVRYFAETGPMDQIEAMEAQHRSFAEAIRGREITPAEARRLG